VTASSDLEIVVDTDLHGVTGAPGSQTLRVEAVLLAGTLRPDTPAVALDRCFGRRTNRPCGTLAALSALAAASQRARKIMSAAPAGMADAGSRTRSRHAARFESTFDVHVATIGEYLNALSSRFSQTCSSRRRRRQPCADLGHLEQHTALAMTW